MAEGFKAQAWKACVLSKVPWVRIPLSPPLSFYKKYDTIIIKKESNYGNISSLSCLSFGSECNERLNYI